VIQRMAQIMVGHRHGAVLLVVRAFKHPGVSSRPMEEEQMVPALG
jgi:hypothetical protein